jgi:TonB family protein
MKKVLILGLFAVVSLSSFAQRKEFLNSEMRVLEGEVGASYSRTSQRTADGQYEVAVNYVTGNLFLSGKYADEKLTKENGHFVYYYENGTKMSEGDYSNGIKVGKWIRNTEDGSPLPDRVYQSSATGGSSASDPSNNASVKASFTNIEKYIDDNLKYPEKAAKAGTKGTVLISFVVDETGAVKNPKVIQGVSAELDAAALQVILSMPAWTPGQRNGAPISSEVVMPVTFE